MHSDIKQQIDSGNISQARYAMRFALELDPSGISYADDLRYCENTPGFFEEYEELTPLRSEPSHWDAEYWEQLKSDLSDNYSRKRYYHMLEVVKIVFADKLNAITSSRTAETARLETQRKAEEAARLEARRKADEAAQLEARRKAEEAAQLEARRKAEEAARLEARRKAEEAARAEEQPAIERKVVGVYYQDKSGNRIDPEQLKRIADSQPANQPAMPHTSQEPPKNSVAPIVIGAAVVGIVVAGVIIAVTVL